MTLFQALDRNFSTKNIGYKHFGYFCLMKWMKRIFDFYLDASIHVAFAVFSLVQITWLTLNIPSDKHLSWFLFFGTISCYNFIKYGVEAEKYLLVANRYHKNIQLLSFIASGLALYHAYYLSIAIWSGLVILVLLTVLYAVPLLPNAKNLRSWGGLKIFIVALVWSGATVILPGISVHDSVPWDIGVEAFQRFLLVLILLIPFEIRDLQYDQKELRTIPQHYGVTKTKIFGAFLVLLFFFGTFLKDRIGYNELLGKGMLFLGLGCLMYKTKRQQSKYFASFWVEGIPVIWYVILVFLEYTFSPHFAIAVSS
ncbi:hypothetical protein [Maribacter sp. 2210JD10-5]|uniref:hypothetical protein n=1 Tax=Maribacter sp. 2210JD10-5 TaxID=3386272 RepID=UPI0039BD4ABF